MNMFQEGDLRPILKPICRGFSRGRSIHNLATNGGGFLQYHLPMQRVLDMQSVFFPNRGFLFPYEFAEE